MPKIAQSMKKQMINTIEIIKRNTLQSALSIVTIITEKITNSLKSSLMSFDDDSSLLDISYKERIRGKEIISSSENNHGSEIFIDLSGLDPVRVFIALQKNALPIDGEDIQPIDSYEEAEETLKSATFKDGKIFFHATEYKGRNLNIGLYVSERYPHRLCVLRGSFNYNVLNDTNDGFYEDDTVGLCRDVIESVVFEQKFLNQQPHTK